MSYAQNPKEGSSLGFSLRASWGLPIWVTQEKTITIHGATGMQIKEGDSFNSTLWGGACSATFDNGCLKLYRASRGVDTRIQSWKCQSVADTKKFLDGQEVLVLWCGSQGREGKYAMKMTSDDNITVYHNNKPYSVFTRMKVRFNIHMDLC